MKIKIFLIFIMIISGNSRINAMVRYPLSPGDEKRILTCLQEHYRKDSSLRTVTLTASSLLISIMAEELKLPIDQVIAIVIASQKRISSPTPSQPTRNTIDPHTHMRDAHRLLE